MAVRVFFDNKTVKKWVKNGVLDQPNLIPDGEH